MADITQTAANVRSTSNARRKSYTAGENGIEPGDQLYLDSNKVKNADNSTEAKATVIGTALGYADLDQPVEVHESGDLNPGGTVVVGECYVVSSNSGKIAPSSDLTTGQYCTYLGIGKSTSLISYNPDVTGATHA